MADPSTRTSRTDPGALSAGIVAAAIAVFMVQGVHSLLTAILGTVVVLVALAYDGNSLRTKFQSVAFVSTLAFGLLLPLGLIFELCLSGWDSPGVIDENGNVDSAVNDNLLALSWAILTIAGYFLDRRFQNRS